MQVIRTLVLTAVVIGMTAVWASPASAQQNVSNQDEGIGVGVVGGISRISFTGDDEADIDPLTAKMLGLWVGGNRNGRVGFVGEFLYVWRKLDLGGGSELSFPAVEIPAVVHINIGSSDRNKGMGRVIVGPVFTMNLAEKIDGEKVDDDQFQGADIGLMVGGGFEIFRVAVEVRGVWGLRSITSEGDVVELKTRAIEFVGKFRFN
jgi:hypothetical protein